MVEPDDVASKVLRRAHVSKLTRTLQNRLALANVKIKNGWECLSLEAIEPVVDVELKRKRPGSSNETVSDVSSVSDRFHHPSLLDSSPLTVPVFSHSGPRSVSRASSSSHSQTKRPRLHRTVHPASSNHARQKTRAPRAAGASWKNSFQLPESSPVDHRRHARFGRIHVPSLSFVSEVSAHAGLHSPLLSEEDDEDLLITSFSITESHGRRSPVRAPRTPPPHVARSARLRQKGFNAAGAAREGKSGEQDAELIMCLAASPTPARPGSVKGPMVAPSTPPSKATPLPSSMMSTPGGSGVPFSGFGLATPSTHLNFAEFLNMSPSPAQLGASWSRTPMAGKTPIASREPRRRIDNLILPGDSPLVANRAGKIEGLGMDLGGELVS